MDPLIPETQRPPAVSRAGVATLRPLRSRVSQTKLGDKTSSTKYATRRLNHPACPLDLVLSIAQNLRRHRLTLR